MDVRLLIESLLGEIAAAEESIAEKRSIVKFLQLRVEQAPKGQDASLIGESPGIRARFEQILARPTLSSKVAEVLREFGSRSFTVVDVHDALMRVGVDLPDDPRTKITTILSRMAEAGSLIRTSTGSGNVPHKYITTPVAGQMVRRTIAPESTK